MCSTANQPLATARLTKQIAVSPDELKDASSEFNAKVQIVSRPPDQTLYSKSAIPEVVWSPRVRAGS